MKARTVDEAFRLFIQNKINLDSEVVAQARESRDNLLENIHGFNGDSDFFQLYSAVDIQFGSFARGTKIRPLDDIDLMVGLSAMGCSYTASRAWRDVRMNASTSDNRLLDCSEDGLLNSTKILNRFIAKLKGLPDYSRSELHKNQQAVVLNLVSKEWSFDIVPCFLTEPEADGRSYYLIPNGHGGWMKTDPVRDRDVLENENTRLGKKLTLLIRLMKKWNKIKKMKSLDSYTMEALVVNQCMFQKTLSNFPDIAFRDFLPEFAKAIWSPIEDIKGIQGDLNTLGVEDRQACSSRALADYQKALHARSFEHNGEQSAAIALWREIFGEEFPTYA